MDTSQVYIKMCEKAKEIQALKRSGGKGDVWTDGKRVEIGDINEQALRFFIWLPRQDQLQEMIPGIIPDLYLRRKSNSWYMSWEMLGQWEIEAKTMEQLWLAFVMKEKYNKVWDGEGWVVKYDYEYSIPELLKGKGKWH